MIAPLISGKLFKVPELITGQFGKFYSKLLFSVAICEDNCRSNATTPTNAPRQDQGFETQFK